MSLGLISLISIILGLIILVILSFKGVSILVLGPLISAAVLFLSRESVTAGMNGAYAETFAAFIQNNFLIFLAASILGAMLGESGAANDIAYGIIKMTSRSGKNAKFLTLMGLSFITALLTMGGVSSFVIVFTVAPICKQLFKKMNIPWHFVMAVLVLGGSQFTQATPGSPAIMNLIPIEYLGTTATAAPWMGLITSIAAIAGGAAYIKFELMRAEHKQETFLETGYMFDKTMKSKEIETEKVGSILKALTPSIVLLVALNVFKLPPVLTLFIAILVCGVLYWENYSNLPETISRGAVSASNSIINVCAIVGFAGVIKVVPGFAYLINGLAAIPGPPLLQLVLATNIMAAITGSATAAEGLSLETFSSQFIQAGYDPNIIHRLINLSGCGMDAMPHNGSLINRLEFTKLTHKQGFMHEFIVGGIIPFLVSVLAVFLAEIGIV